MLAPAIRLRQLQAGPATHPQPSNTHTVPGFLGMAVVTTKINRKAMEGHAMIDASHGHAHLVTSSVRSGPSQCVGLLLQLQVTPHTRAGCGLSCRPCVGMTDRVRVAHVCAPTRTEQWCAPPPQPCPPPSVPQTAAAADGSPPADLCAQAHCNELATATTTLWPSWLRLAAPRRAAHGDDATRWAGDPRQRVSLGSHQPQWRCTHMLRRGIVRHDCGRHAAREGCATAASVALTGGRAPLRLL